MSDSSTPLPPAGWYADPENASAERWWNGAIWTDDRRPRTDVPPIPPAPVAPVPLPAEMTPDSGVAPSVEPVFVQPVFVQPASVEPAPGQPAAVQPAAVAAPGPAADPRPDPYGYVAAQNLAPAAAPGPYTPNPYAANSYITQGYAPAPRNPNVVGLVGFIVSMAGILLNIWLFGIVGIAGGIVSAIGLAKANRLAQQGVFPNGRGLALAGTIVGFVTGGLTFIGSVIGVILIIAAGAAAPYYY